MPPGNPGAAWSTTTVLDRERRSLGERTANFCFGALACAVALQLAVHILATIWPWVVGGGAIVGVVWFIVWRTHRW